MRFFELANLLNLIHEISSVYVLHDKIQTVLWGRKRGREVSKVITRAGEVLQRDENVAKILKRARDCSGGRERESDGSPQRGLTDKER